MLANSLVKCCLESHSPGLIWFHQKTRPTSSAKSVFLLLPDLEDWHWTTLLTKPECDHVTFTGSISIVTTLPPQASTCSAMRVDLRRLWAGTENKVTLLKSCANWEKKKMTFFARYPCIFIHTVTHMHHIADFCAHHCIYFLRSASVNVCNVLVSPSRVTCKSC